jgi:glutamate racemase
MGAEKILIACCTASALYPFLSEREKNITLPIIGLTAESIPESHKRVAVIATEYTVKSHAFSEAIKGICPTTEVAEIPMQSLVRKVEISRECGISLEELAAPELASIDGLIKSHRADSLILGCTHFSWLEKILMERYEALEILNPAVLGAKRLAAQISLSSKKREQGRIIYTE